MKIANDYQRNTKRGGIGCGPSGEASDIVAASMSQVEMTIWLCFMAVLGIGMLALLAMFSA